MVFDVKATIFDGGTRRPYTNEDAQALAPTTPYVWIDALCGQLRDPEVLHLLDQMGFSDVVAAYTTRSTSTGMFQAFDDNMLGSTYVAADDPDDAPVLIHCVWNSGCFVTIRQAGGQAVHTVQDEIGPRAKALFADPGPVPGILLQLMLDSIDRQLTDLQTQIAVLDGQIIVTSNPRQLKVLQELRKPVQALGMTLPSYAENVRESLVDPSSLPGVDAHGVQALQTYAACVNDVVQRVESADADVRSAIQDYQGQVSTAQGNRINQLTLVSIIFLPISFLTGYFGMNFQYLVNETQSFITWVLLGVVLPILTVLASAALLRRGGFHVGHLVPFHLRAGDKSHSPRDEPTATMDT